MCETEKGEREPRRYKLKLQEFLWPCISVSVGLGFLTNILCKRATERGSKTGDHKASPAYVLSDSLPLKN